MNRIKDESNQRRTESDVLRQECLCLCVVLVDTQSLKLQIKEQKTHEPNQTHVLFSSVLFVIYVVITRDLII
jgi:hypothetical protein